MITNSEVLKKFKASFFAALAKRGDALGWSTGDHKAAEFYAKNLVTQCDNVLPSIAPELIVVVDDVFAFGIALQRSKGNELPPFIFNGERQESFLELLEVKLSEAERRRAKLKRLKEKRARKAKTASEPASEEQLDNVTPMRRSPGHVADAIARRRAAQPGHAAG